MKNTLYHILTLAVIAVVTSLDMEAEEISDSTQIWFHQSKSVLDPGYMGNDTNLQRMLGKLRDNADTDSALRFKSIRVVGAASPEGSVRINHLLSKHRADRIFDYFATYTELPDSITEFQFIGRDWEGLLEMVKADNYVPHKYEVMSLLDEIIRSIQTTGKDNEQNLLRLKSLNGGVPYLYIYKNLFPKLRYSRLYVDYTYLHPERIILRGFNPEPPMLTANPSGDVSLLPLPLLPPAKVCRPFYMALKTNLLYDALTLPSIGAEFYLGKNWSVVGNWTYGWWDRDKSHRYWRAYGGDIAIRKWFGKEAAWKPLTGHHLGLYAGVVTFDFEFGGKGHMGGLPDRTLWDRCNYMAGIEYGYSLPIANRLNIDFTIGLGYLGGKVIEYVPEGEIYVWQKTKNYNWVGPTKAEVSLTWLIGCGNFNRKFDKKKGGLNENY